MPPPETRKGCVYRQQPRDQTPTSPPTPHPVPTLLEPIRTRFQTLPADHKLREHNVFKPTMLRPREMLTNTTGEPNPTLPRAPRTHRRTAAKRLYPKRSIPPPNQLIATSTRRQPPSLIDLPVRQEQIDHHPPPTICVTVQNALPACRRQHHPSRYLPAKVQRLIPTRTIPVQRLDRGPALPLTDT